MDQQEKKKIIEQAKTFFRENIAEHHIKNTKKLKKLKAFQLNPFLANYLANFAFGDSHAENIAKALIYPRILGTSITTTFGNQMQFFCKDVLRGYASMINGLDIEFEDAVDGRRKYCQMKSGPNTLNKDDVVTIKNHFKNIKNLARTNRNTDINPTRDCIIGILYGEAHQLSGHYKKIREEYPVLVGNEFWHHLTGDEHFYKELIDAVGLVAVEADSRNLIDETIAKLTAEIKIISQ